MNDFLTGSNANLDDVVDRTRSTRCEGSPSRGNYLVLTLDPEAQQVAMDAARRACGAAVALEPRDGRVLAIASSPTYDLNLVEDDFEEVLARRERARPPRRSQPGDAGLFIPGSTFKVVTAAAALDSALHAASRFDDPGYCTVYGKRVSTSPTRAARGLRQRHSRRGARELDQLRLLQHRQGARARS